MSAASDKRPRQVVPRWRPSGVMARLGLTESSTNRARRELPPTTELQQRRQEWLDNRDVPHAADVISTAFGMGLGESVRDVAEFVLTTKEDVPRPLEMLARGIIEGADPLPVSPIDIDEVGRHGRISRLKRRLRDWPRDVLSRVDLALEYTILGQREKASKHITVALSLAPISTFVVRSAVRFFLNNADPERAVFIARRAPRLTLDPWLMAAEIAASAISERNSRLTKAARLMIQGGNFAPKHISELAGALATMELKCGNRRFARRLFRIALQSPTENALAQAEWACKELRELEVEVASRASARSYEATTQINLGQQKWTSVIDNAKCWRLDEPFATRSAHVGSCAAMVVVEDFPMALEFADFGLATKPQDLLLLNNKAVALALMDRPMDAVDVLKKVEIAGKQDDDYAAVHLATSGLVQFRLGDAESGRRLYERARDIAKRRRNLQEETWALLFQAREEARFNLQQALGLLAAAETSIQRLGRRQASVARRLLSLVSRACPATRT